MIPRDYYNSNSTQHPLTSGEAEDPIQDGNPRVEMPVSMPSLLPILQELVHAGRSRNSPYFALFHPLRQRG